MTAEQPIPDPSALVRELHAYAHQLRTSIHVPHEGANLIESAADRIAELEGERGGLFADQQFRMVSKNGEQWPLQGAHTQLTPGEIARGWHLEGRYMYSTPWHEVTAPRPDFLPPRYGSCNCECHINSNVKHIAPCCHPVEGSERR